MAFWKNWDFPIVEEATPYVPKKTKVTVEEIHNEFFTEVDRLLEESKLLNSLTSPKQSLVDKSDRLKKLGFGNAEDVSSAREEETRLRVLQSENEAKRNLARAIEYLTVRYPQYKFITEASVKKICEKYGLIYGEVSRYVGAVPDKNLEQIENFKIDEKDECYAVEDSFVSTFSFERRVVRQAFISKPSADLEMERLRKRTYSPSGFESTIRKCSLEIAAPKSEFNMTAMEVKNFKLQTIPVPDPIVLCPVLFENQKHYLVVTAWGDEAKDVVNEKLN